MKKLVFLLLIGGFITSNFFADKELEAKNSSGIESPFEEVKKVSSSEKMLLGEISERKYLFVTIHEGIVHKAFIAKTNNSETIEIATISKDKIEQLLTLGAASTKDFNQKANFKKRFSSQIGISIDHIIVLDKQGYIDVYSKVFPNGVSLKLTDEMKKNIAIKDDSDQYLVKNAIEFLEIVKKLNQNHHNKQEIYSMLAQSLTIEIAKPEVLISLVGIVNELDQFVYTDLSIDELLSLGFSVMNQSRKEVEKFEIPNNEQQVIETTPYEKNNF